MRWWAVGLLLFKNKQKLLGIFKSEIQLLLIVSILYIFLIQQIYISASNVERIISGDEDSHKETNMILELIF